MRIKILWVVTFLCFAILFPAMARKAESPWARFKSLVAKLKNRPDMQLAGGEVVPANYTERDELLKTYAVLKPKPAVPPAAKAHFQKGNDMMQALQSMAQKPDDYKDAINEYTTAIDAAPWWPDAYFNLAIALEDAHQYDSAIASVNDYLLAKPDNGEGNSLFNKLRRKKSWPTSRPSKKPRSRPSNSKSSRRNSSRSKPISKRKRCKISSTTCALNTTARGIW